MTVKEVKNQVENLNENYRNMIKLQEYFLGHSAAPESEIDNVRSALENDADLSSPIRDLCSDVARILDSEVKRLEKIIDNAIVNVG